MNAPFDVHAIGRAQQVIEAPAPDRHRIDSEVFRFLEIDTEGGNVADLDVAQRDIGGFNKLDALARLRAFVPIINQPAAVDGSASLDRHVAKALSRDDVASVLQPNAVGVGLKQGFGREVQRHVGFQRQPIIQEILPRRYQQRIAGSACIDAILNGDGGIRCPGVVRGVVADDVQGLAAKRRCLAEQHPA